MIFTKFLIILILKSIPLMVEAIIGGQTVHEPHEFPWVVLITKLIDG